MSMHQLKIEIERAWTLLVESVLSVILNNELLLPYCDEPHKSEGWRRPSLENTPEHVLGTWVQLCQNKK